MAELVVEISAATYGEFSGMISNCEKKVIKDQ